MNIAITGASGLIGSRTIELLQNDFNFIALPSSEFDITKVTSVQKKLSNLNYDVFLHFASYTNVDKAEIEQEVTYQLNVEGTKNVFDITKEKDKKFVYISTDFVFDGQNPPYFEDSTPEPLSTYAKTKYEGEQLVQGQAMIIRPSYPYRKEFSRKRDFVRNIRYCLEQGQELSMVTDSLITPTFIDDFANALKYLLQNFSNEIYHVVGSDSISPYEAGKLIARTFNMNEGLINPITYAEYYQNKAQRPRYSEIKSKKNIPKMSSFEEGLHKLK